MTERTPPADDARQYFDTKAIRKDLHGKSVRGGALTAAAQVIKALLQMISTLVLVRMLTPKDFGLIGMAVVVTGFIAMFRDLGLSLATVQREDITHEQVSTLFWINLGLSAATMLVTALIAPALAWFYGEPRLTLITLYLAGSFLFAGLSLQHAALLRRRMRFGALAVVDLSSLAAGIGAAITMAVLGFGYWALVGQQIVTVAVAAAACWALCGWRPGMARRRCGIGSLIAFGGNITGFSVVNYFARNLDQVLLGYFYGPLAVGFYQKAYDILLVPLRQINEPISSVAIPALSRLTEQPELYRSTYLRILEKILMVTMPMGAMMIMTSDWLVLVLFGEQWIETGYIFAALGLALFTQPIGNSTGWLFISQNRTHHFFRWGFIGSGTAVASFLIGLPWGAFGVALSYSLIGMLVRKPLLIWYVTRYGPIRPMDFVRVAAPHALVAAAVAGALGAFRFFSPAQNPASGLLLATTISLLVALGILAILPQGRAALRDAAQLASNLRRRRSTQEEPPLTPNLDEQP